MKTIKNMICCAALLTVASAAYAQHLDPTVSVTKDYEGKLLEVDKPAMKVEVPDSVTRFNLDFDYSVLDNGFKGSYSFVPYALDMRPKPDSYREKQLWLRAGLGFTLHPTLDLVWSPRMKGNYRMSIYARHDSYYGRYASVNELLDGTVGSLPKDNPARRYAAWHCDKDSEGKQFSPVGYDLLTRVGTNGRYDWATGSVNYDVAYLGVATDDKTVFNFKKGYNAGDIKAHVQSVRDDSDYLLYDVRLGMRFGSESLRNLNPGLCGLNSFGGKLNEFVFSLGSRLGPVIRTEHGVFVDVDLNAMTYGKSLQTHSGNLALTPKYSYKTERMNFEAGLRIDFFFRPKDAINEKTGTALYQDKGQFFYPDVKFDYAILPDFLDVYARVGGGNHPVPYSHYIEQNHNFSLAYNSPAHSILENTNEAASTLLGLRGNVRHKFFWDVDGGWLYTRATPLDAISAANLPTIWSGDYHCAFASLKAGYKTERVDFETFVDYKWTSIMKDFESGKADKDGNLYVVEGVVEPIRLLAGAKFNYNWKNRVYAGLNAQVATNRRVAGKDAFIPWYCDLGLNFQYKWKPRISLWAEAGNLLGQSIQHNVGFAEYGPNLTVGICVIL